MSATVSSAPPSVVVDLLLLDLQPEVLEPCLGLVLGQPEVVVGDDHDARALAGLLGRGCRVGGRRRRAVGSPGPCRPSARGLLAPAEPGEQHDDEQHAERGAGPRQPGRPAASGRRRAAAVPAADRGRHRSAPGWRRARRRRRGRPRRRPLRRLPRPRRPGPRPVRRAVRRRSRPWRRTAAAGSLASAVATTSRRCARDLVGQRRRLVAQVRERRAHRGVAGERPGAGQALVEHHAERVDVAGLRWPACPRPAPGEM